MKKLIYICLALALTVVLGASAMAAAADSVPPQQAAGEKGSVILNGSVSNDATDLISVTMPLSVDFIVATDENEHYAGITHVKGTVVNNSASPVKMEVTNVSDTNKIMEKMNLALAPLSAVEQSGAVVDSKAFESAGAYWLNKVVNPSGVAAGTSVKLIDRLAANGGTEMITTCGQKLDDATAIPAGAYTVVTTITIGLVT